MEINNTNLIEYVVNFGYCESCSLGSNSNIEQKLIFMQDFISEKQYYAT